MLKRDIEYIFYTDIYVYIERDRETKRRKIAHRLSKNKQYKTFNFQFRKQMIIFALIFKLMTTAVNLMPYLISYY